MENFQTIGDVLLRRYLVEYVTLMRNMPSPRKLDDVFESGKWKIQGGEREGIIAHDCDPEKWSAVKSGKFSCPSCYEFVPHEVINTYRILYMRNP